MGVGVGCDVEPVSLQANIGAMKTRGCKGVWSSSSVALRSGGLRKVRLDASLKSLLDPSLIEPHESSSLWQDNNYKCIELRYLFDLLEKDIDGVDCY